MNACLLVLSRKLSFTLAKQLQETYKFSLKETSRMWRRPGSLGTSLNIGTVSSRSLSSAFNEGKEQDGSSKARIKLYYEEDMQRLLKRLTGRDLKKVFRNRKLGQKLKEPKYEFMTGEELEEELQKSCEKADGLLEMPPVLAVRDPIDEILSFDPHLQGLEDSTYILTDISLNVSNRDRIIVARDRDGTLRKARWDERDKMNAIYFPIEGQDIITPQIFTDHNLLQQLLERASENDNTYEYALDKACVQFEPDDPLYVASVEQIYRTIDEKRHYDMMKSTRHYGPMVFYLVRTRNMDTLLCYSLQCKRLKTDALDLVKVFHLLFPHSKSKSLSETLSSEIEIIQAYVKEDSIKKDELQVALNYAIEQERNQAEYEDSIKKAHGL